MISVCKLITVVSLLLVVFVVGNDGGALKRKRISDKVKQRMQFGINETELEETAALLAELRAIQGVELVLPPPENSTDITMLPSNATDSKITVNGKISKKHKKGNGRRKASILAANSGLESVLFDGDEMLDKKQLLNMIAHAKARQNRTNDRSKRQAMNIENPSYRLWDKTRTIYFKFNEDFSNTETFESDRELFREAAQYWTDNTCLNLAEVTPRTTNSAQIMTITNNNACSSQVGRGTNAKQFINLGRGDCAEFTTYAHEIGHALGFHHGHIRWDRDDYVTVENTKGENATKFEINYGILDQDENNNYGLPYDFGSVMHYRRRDEDDPVQPINEDENYIVGAREKIAFIDLKMMNMLYSCGTPQCSKTISCKNKGFAHPKYCDTCICPRGFGGADCSTRETQKHTVSDCGGIVSATSAWKTVSVTVDSESTSEEPRWDAATCNWHITAPDACKQVVVKFNSFDEDDAVNFIPIPCEDMGLEFRGKTFEITGPRVCNGRDVDSSKEFKSTSNKAIVTVFSKYNAPTASFSYKYAAIPNCRL